MAKAKESTQVQRARAKLQKQLEKEHRQVTPQALMEAVAEMRQWIARHAKDRLQLKDKAFALFDENEHSAAISNQYVRQLKEQILKEKEESSTLEDLRGRVTKPREISDKP